MYKTDESHTVSENSARPASFVWSLEPSKFSAFRRRAELPLSAYPATQLADNEQPHSAGPPPALADVASQGATARSAGLAAGHQRRGAVRHFSSLLQRNSSPGDYRADHTSSPLLVPSRLVFQTSVEFRGAGTAVLRLPADPVDPRI